MCKPSGSTRSQTRAGVYRSRSKSVRIIRVLDEMGAYRTIKIRKQLNVKSHQSTLSALERRAQRFQSRFMTPNEQDEVLIANACVQTMEMEVNILRSEGCSEQEQAEIRQLLQEKSHLLEVIGVEPGKKADGIVRLVYENVNGLQASIAGNKKLDKLKVILDDLEADVFAFNEHRNNLRHKLNRRHGLNQMFFGGETMVRGIWGSNRHEGDNKYLDKKVMEGGTGMVAFGEMASLIHSEGTTLDDSGLARWTVMEFRGEERFSTKILCGYVPCKNKKFDSGTSYQQQRRYFIRKEKKDEEPRARMLADLTTVLTKWREEGHKIVVCLDANEDVYKDIIGRTLTDTNGLNMAEAVHACTGHRLGATHFRGSRPIDAVWTTKDVELANACAMPIGYGSGDHRMFVVDIVKDSIVGTQPQAIVRPGARKLNSRIPTCMRNYNRTLERLIEKHRLREKLQSCLSPGISCVEMKERLDKIDDESKQYMLHAEKKCRKIRCGQIPFSPEASLWIKRTQFYRSLLRFWNGKGQNRSNLKRLAWRCKIKDPFSISPEEIAIRLRECKTQCRYFKIHGQHYRRQHLSRCLEEAKEKQDEESEKRILQIMQRERDRAFWRRLNWALGKKRGSSVSAVQVPDGGGGHVELRTQEDIQQAIWDNVHQSRYHLAEEAPICQGKLRGEFGYNADTVAGKQVLEGTYQFGDDFHEGTKRICQAISEVRSLISQDSVDHIITKDVWQQQWKKKKEETSSSVSKLHFGHYITGAHSEMISDFHALKTSLAIVHGVALERWSSGLCVMLEKKAGVKLINKLRTILLMEADFNAANKIIYGERMMDNVRKHNFMPEEIFSEKSREATDGGLGKKLFVDTVNQLRRPAGLASVDAANCYDRVAHAISNMVFQAFGTPQKACMYMHSAIQEMKFFLRTAFGDSKESVGARIELKTQGFMQGNGASPAGWAVVSIVIIHAHKQEGHGATFLCPITKKKKSLAGILYVDDTDIVHLNMSRVETISEAHAALQRSLDSWSELLIATGGSLKPEKCFYYLIGFVWDRKGQWSHSQLEEREEYGISVILPDGSRASIEHLSVNEARITLGMSCCPSGKTDNSLVKEKDEAALSPIALMQEKAIAWAEKAKRSGLSRREVHFSVRRKMWPKISYGLCTNDAPYDEIVQAMHKPYHMICALGGLARSAKRELRFLDSGFYGFGLPHWGIEATIESVNKILTHYGCDSIVGTQYQLSVELLLIELGTSSQPFLEDYDALGDPVTDCLVKEVWSRLHRFRIKLSLGNVQILPAREGDRWFMTAVKELGFNEQELQIINRIRIHQEVLFESDVLGADGRQIDPKYLRLRGEDEKWSDIIFPIQFIPHSHITLWKSALMQIAPGGRRPQGIGKFIRHSHKIWHWRYNSDQERLLYSASGDQVEVKEFVRDTTNNRRSRHEAYTPTEMLGTEFRGRLCTVEVAEDGKVRILSQGPAPPTTQPPGDFLEVLRDWGCTWLWRDLKITNSSGSGIHSNLFDGGDWIREAIMDRSLMGVTDGSYIRDLCPHLCSAAVIIECQRGRGRMTLTLGESCQHANAYRGELLGLMALHLLLLSFNKKWPDLEGEIKIYSDCLGALHKVEHLPPGKIPSRCRHSDILKNIMLQCNALTFRRTFYHVKAHQDDYEDYANLDRPAQLNSGCDYGAKEKLVRMVFEDMYSQHPFPLETVSIYVDGHKLTTDSGQQIRFSASKREARQIFADRNVLEPESFDKVDWGNVYGTLHELPTMFQVFACKQVFDESATFQKLHKRRDPSAPSPTCPFCKQHPETSGHILSCPEAGRIEMLKKYGEDLMEWMMDQDLPRDLTYLIVEFIRQRGNKSMEEVAHCLPDSRTFLPFAKAQDSIGWRRFLEGMVASEFLTLLDKIERERGEQIDSQQLVRGLIRKLLEITHGMWIYRNLLVHDSIAGLFACERKEKLMEAIDEQLALGDDGLREEDKWLLEVQLADLAGETAGEKEAYWVMAITMARARYRLLQRDINNGGMRGIQTELYRDGR